mmetsp:Transcript_17775/g.41406  ORF Transcript_17775/g.41406 Transcript_17775/m.41406 type:complete len:173 (-) Transcript_17775:1411-1929(-)
MPSDSASSADVASSSNKMVGCIITARAIATRCFCPPESCVPFSPTRVAYLSGKSSMKAWQLASFAASSIRSCTSLLCRSSLTPNRMFSSTLTEKRIGSCETMAMLRRKNKYFSSRISYPSILTTPDVTSYNRWMRLMHDDLPDPDCPTRAVTPLVLAVQETPFKTSTSDLVG